MVKYLVKLPYLALLIILLFSLSACEFTSKPRFEGEVYTVAGLLVAGESISTENPIFVTRSISLEDFDPFELFVEDAEVTVIDLQTNERWELEEALDPSRGFIYVDPQNRIIQPLQSYRLEVRIDGKPELIWAETTVPQAVTPVMDFYQNNPPGTGWSLDPETANTVQYSILDQQYPIVLGTGAQAGDFNFMAEIYCREPFSTDLEWTTPIFGITNLDESLEPIYNSNGQSFRRINVMGIYTSKSQPGMDGNYLVLPDYATSVAFYGRYRVSAYIIDDNYYEYSYRPEGYFYGGINNALGYFGSASGADFYARVVK